MRWSWWLGLAMVACGSDELTPTGEGTAGQGPGSGGSGGTKGGSAGTGGQVAAGAGLSGSSGQTTGGSGGSLAGAGGAAEAGAGGASEAGGGGAGASAGSGGQVGLGGGGPVEARLAKVVTLDSVAVFQTVKVLLEQGGSAVAQRNAPVVAGRGAVVRAYVKPGAGFTARVLRAALTIEVGGQTATWQDERTISGASSDADEQGVFAFEVPAEAVQPTSQLRVQVLDDDEEIVAAGSSSAAQFPQDGSLAGLGAEALAGALRIMLVPMRYDTDGSGRLPDTSAAQLDVFRELLHAVYPAVKIELKVHDPVPWNHALTLGGSVKFGTLNGLLEDLRADENPPEDVYYYGLISPSTSLSKYCKGTCTTGQSYVVDDIDDAEIRVGGGMGFTGEDSAWTLAHELGHLHGQSHAPCDVSSWDPEFPYKDGALGVWGYDERGQVFVDPTEASDVMGYCEPLWISDYTYRAFFQRIKALGAQSAQKTTAAPMWLRLAEEQDGAPSVARPVRHRAGRGQPREVIFRDASGAELARATAERAALSHGGATWWLPWPPAGARQASIELGGVLTTVELPSR